MKIELIVNKSKRSKKIQKDLEELYDLEIKNSKTVELPDTVKRHFPIAYVGTVYIPYSRNFIDQIETQIQSTKKAETFFQKLKRFWAKGKKLTPKIVLNWLIAHWRYYFQTTTAFKTEQVNWRLEQVRQRSPPCYKNHECKHCSCDVNWEGGLEYGKDPCEGNCFPKWMNKIEWRNYKIKNNVRI